MERPLSYGREHIQTFVSPAETAFASVERTANQLRRDIHRMLRTQGLTLAQYNVLRALGKEASGGLTCSELGNRLAGADPDITRLLDRLAKQRLVRRRRDIRDRRAVVTELTEQGRCCWHPSPLHWMPGLGSCLTTWRRRVCNCSSSCWPKRENCRNQPNGRRSPFRPTRAG